MLDIYKVALELARAVGVQGGRIAVHDKDLARQMRRSMASVVLNIAEGAGCDGGTRRQRYKDALGSAHETQAALELGEAMGYGVEIDAETGLGLHRFESRVALLVECKKRGGSLLGQATEAVASKQPREEAQAQVGLQ